MPTLITISSSSIGSLCDSCSACLLPTIHPGNTALHSNRSYTLAGGSLQQAEGCALEQNHDPPFYLGRSRSLRHSRYTGRRLEIASVYKGSLEYGLGPLPYLGRSRMLQSSYTSRRWQIASAYGSRYGSGDKEDGSHLAKGKGLSGSYAIISWRDWYTHTIDSVAVQLCPDGDPKVIWLLSESFLAGVKGDPTRLSLQTLYG